jgi:hypothetical protein
VQEAKTTRHALLKNAAQRLIGHTRLRVLHAWHSYTRECVTERQGVYAKVSNCPISDLSAMPDENCALRMACCAP